MLWLISLFFIVGSCIGSFLNVVAIRVPLNRSFVYNRSQCPNCGKTLSWYELIPLVSFILQQGRCCGCHYPITYQYLIVELVTGILFSYSYIHFGPHPELLGSLLLVCLCIVVCITDLTHMIIPNEILLSFLPFFIIVRIIFPLQYWYSSIIGAVLGFLIIGTIIYVSKGGMGVGDMKLLMLFGILLGWNKILLTFFIAVLFGSMVGIFILVQSRRKKQRMIPFAPFLSIAALISYAFGDKIISFYIAMIGFGI